MITTVITVHGRNLPTLTFTDYAWASLFSEVQYASCTIGVFLCETCAGIHRSLGAHLSRIKSLKLDNWDDNTLRVITMIAAVTIMW